MNDEKAFRSRNFDLNANQHYLGTLLNQLAEAQRKTDPTTQSSATGKDHKAFSTLLRASELVEAVAGWALDHVCGLSLAGLKMLPSQPDGSKSHPDYVESRHLSDVHEHELEGGEPFIRKPLDPEIRRLILRNLVFAGAGGFPSWLREELLEALDALDSGTTMPLLRPKRRAGTEYLKARARLRLVTFVKFRSRAYAISEEKTRDFIGSSIGRGAEAIKDWEQRLKASCLGPLEVHRQIAFALNAAARVRRAIELKHTGEVSERDISLADYHERRWGIDALRQAVTEWRDAEGLREAS